MKIEVNIKKRQAFLIIVLLGILIGLVGAYAVFSPPSSGVFHKGDEVNVDFNSEERDLNSVLEELRSSVEGGIGMGSTSTNACTLHDELIATSFNTGTQFSKTVSVPEGCIGGICDITIVFSDGGGVTSIVSGKFSQDDSGRWAVYPGPGDIDELQVAGGINGGGETAILLYPKPIVNYNLANSGLIDDVGSCGPGQNDFCLRSWGRTAKMYLC